MRFKLPLIILLITLPTLVWAKKQHKETPPPNIIWLMAEDISTDLGCYGTKGVKTPTIDKLANEGVLFTNCFATSSICSPSRSAMMTGTHQVNINAHHHRSNQNIPLPQEIKPITYHLREYGYTCIIGHHGVNGKGRKIDCNFKYEIIGPWDGINHFGLFDKKDEFLPEDQPFFNQIELTTTHRGDWWDKIREQSPSPVNIEEIELPPYLADHPTIRLDWAKYLDQIEFIDQEIKMILQELEEKGMADNTMIVFCADNGRANIKGKGYLHDSGLRVPLFVYYPAAINGGYKNPAAVSTTDITATILDVAGIDIPYYMTGQSFFDRYYNREEIYSARDTWDEILDKSRSITTAEWKYILNYMPEVPYDAKQAYPEFYRPALHIMRSLSAKGELTEAQQTFFAPQKADEELYDLSVDPFELNNLINDATLQDVVEQMRIRLAEYEQGLKPISDTLDIIHPISVDVLEWVKENDPEAIKRMEEGIEIGFHKYMKAYLKDQ